MAKLIYKILDRDEWSAAKLAGRYSGSADDLRDGFIHFSTASQLAETAAKHFAGRENLMILAIESTILGSKLKWEASRDNQLFPHLYGAFEIDQVCLIEPLPLGEGGKHDFPANLEID